MSLSVGQRLGPYEIDGFIGAGGMGEVYSAIDTRLKRSVAIKILRSEQHGRRERFEFEARAISSLSHAHICSLYDVGEHAGTSYLVMERLEGETLGKRLKRGPLSLNDALEAAIQVAEALDHAHTRGLLHRDLKPDNIMLSGQKRNIVKLLDFGLAKVMPQVAAAAGDGAPPRSDTLPLTAEGAVVGTLQYMAPEQLDGRKASVSTDIFAFGAVLYEMVTGKKAFKGNSRATLMAAILKDSPAPVSATLPGASPVLCWIIDKCLAKPPEERWHSARDLADTLKWLRQSGAAPESHISLSSGKAWWWAAAGIAVAALGLTGATIAMSGGATRVVAPATVTRFEILLPEKTTLGEFDYPVLSPDGTQIVTAAQTGTGRALLIRRLDSLDIRVLAGTQGASYPFWSPDGRSVGFFSGSKLKKIDIAGETTATITDAADGIGGTWNRDGVIVFCPKLDSTLMRVNASGGAGEGATKLDAAHHQTSQLFPEFLPDGRHFVFYGISAGREQEFDAAYLGSLDTADVRPLFRTMCRAMFAEPGYLLFASADRLMAQAFDLKRLALSGQPKLIVEGVGNVGAVLGSAYSVANDSIAFRAGAKTPPALTWVRRNGERLSGAPESGQYGNPALSPDGGIVAADYRESPMQPRSLWLIGLQNGNKTRLTFTSEDEFNPTWSRDGKRIAFTSTRHGTRDIYEKPANGTGPERLVFQSGLEKNVEDWSPDGNYLLFNTRVPGQPIEIWALALVRDGKAFRVASARENCEQGQFSPDGKWVTYRSYETGKPQIFVEEFPPAGGKWQISTSSGSDPQWRRDGKELFYMDVDRLMAVEVHATGRQFEASAPRELFEAKLWHSGRNGFAASSDGQKFLMNIAPPEKSATGFVVMTNWSSGLGR